MTTTIYNSKDIKYIWNTSDDDGLISLTFISDNWSTSDDDGLISSFVSDNDIIYAVECAYDDDTKEMKYTYYKSTNTDNNKELWNQLMLDDLENFDKCFKEVTDEEDIVYIEHRERVYRLFITGMRHVLSHDTLYSMIVALYTSITNETSVPKNILHSIHDDVLNMLRGNHLQSPKEYIKLVSDIIDLIKKHKQS
jgi:hypothetical protein